MNSIYDHGLEMGDLVSFPSYWGLRDELFVYVGLEDYPEAVDVHRYRFLGTTGRVFRFFGSSECEVVARISEALG